MIKALSALTVGMFVGTILQGLWLLAFIKATIITVPLTIIAIVRWFWKNNEDLNEQEESISGYAWEDEDTGYVYDDED
tara:strand:+ start:252 stop:485 length:234 start_codon:yes stop_codon:yes gene_type:complete